MKNNDSSLKDAFFEYLSCQNSISEFPIFTNDGKLGYMRRVFGIKNMKRNNKIRGFDHA